MPFLFERFPAYGIDTEGDLYSHFRLVQKLRTFFQHNLDLSHIHDQETEEVCREWFLDACGTVSPDDDPAWSACLRELLTHALHFIRGLEACVRAIERDESRQLVIDQWIFRLERYHAPYQFDELIPVVAADMGRELIDPIRLRQRHYESWMMYLSQLRSNYEFGVEARKLIERTLLTETHSILPISGVDIMEVFGIPPGPKVGELLAKARQLYEERPCTREELLERLRGGAAPTHGTGRQ